MERRRRRRGHSSHRLYETRSERSSGDSSGKAIRWDINNRLLRALPPVTLTEGGWQGDAKRRVVYAVLPDWPWAKEHNPLRREIITPLGKSYRMPRDFCVSWESRTNLLTIFPSVLTPGPAAYNAVSHHVDVLATLPSTYIFFLPVPFIEAILSAESIDIPNTSN